MKKFLLIIIIVIAGLFVFDRLIDVIIQKTLVVKSKFHFSRYVTGKKAKDIYVLGNSRALNSFEEDLAEPVFHKSAMNMAYGMMDMQMVRIIALDICRKAEKQPQKPTIYIEVSALFSDPNFKGHDTKTIAILPEYNMYADNFPDLKEYYKKHTPGVYYTNLFFKCYKYNNELFYRNFEFLKKSDADWVLDEVVNSRLIKSTEEMKPFSFSLDSTRMVYMKEILETAKRSGVPVNLYLAPYMPEYLSKIQNLKQVTDSIFHTTGARVIDLSALFDNDKCFADMFHPNRFCIKDLMEALKEKSGPGAQ